MLDHLLDFEPPVVEATGKDVSGLDRATPDQILNAQVNTTKWLEKLGVEDDQKILQEAEAKAARTVFAALANNATPAETKNQLTLLKTPESVRHLVTLLSAYDWEFVEQAKQMRGMAVAKIIEETNHPDARIRLKAIEMLGRVTEVALFTDRLEVKKTDLTDAEIDQKLQDKLDKLLNVIDVDITVGETTPDITDITDVEPSQPDQSEHSLTSEEPPAPTDDES
jgi:hypothetical protein